MTSPKNLAFFLSIMLMTGVPQCLPAIDDRKLDPSAQEMAADMKRKFELSDAQEQELIPVFEYHLKKRDEFYRRERRGANKKKLRQEVRALREEVEARIAKIVTPEQIRKWQAANPVPPAPAKRPAH